MNDFIPVTKSRLQYDVIVFQKKLHSFIKYSTHNIVTSIHFITLNAIWTIIFLSHYCLNAKITNVLKYTKLS